MKNWFKKLKRFRVADMQRLIDEDGAKLVHSTYGFWDDAPMEACALSMLAFSILRDGGAARRLVMSSLDYKRLAEETGYTAAYLRAFEGGFEWPTATSRWRSRAAYLGFKDGFALRALVSKEQL